MDKTGECTPANTQRKQFLYLKNLAFDKYTTCFCHAYLYLSFVFDFFTVIVFIQLIFMQTRAENVFFNDFGC